MSYDLPCLCAFEGIVSIICGVAILVRSTFVTSSETEFCGRVGLYMSDDYMRITFAVPQATLEVQIRRAPKASYTLHHTIAAMQIIRHFSFVILTLTRLALSQSQYENDAQIISIGITTMANSIPLPNELHPTYRYGISSSIDYLAIAYLNATTTLSEPLTIEDSSAQVILHTLGDQEARFKAMSDRLVGLESSVVGVQEYGNFSIIVYHAVASLDGNLTAYYDALASRVSVTMQDQVIKSKSTYKTSADAMVTAYASQVA